MANRFWVGGTGNWSDTAHWSTTSGGAGGASVPNFADAAIVNGSSGGGTITLDIDDAELQSLTLGGSNLTMQKNLVVSGTVTLTSGELNVNEWSLTCGSLISSNTNVRSINIVNATVTLTGTGVVWDVSTSTNLTLNASGATIVISDTSSAAKEFRGGGQSYNGLYMLMGSGTLTLTGDMTFFDTTWQLPLILTGTVTVTNTIFLEDGQSCPSITGGTLSVASGTVTAPSGCVITNNTATGGATFDSSAATLVGVCTGWSTYSAAAFGAIPFFMFPHVPLGDKL